MSRIDAVYASIKSCSVRGCVRAPYRRGMCSGHAKENKGNRMPPDPRRERALQVHASDPELSLADIARRLGVRRKSVSEWVTEETRARGKG